MTVLMRWALLAAAALTALSVRQRLKNERIQADDATFRLLFAVMLALLAALPSVGVWFARKLGLATAGGFALAAVVVVLALRCGVLAARLAELERKVAILAQEAALRDNAERREASRREDRDE